MKAEEAAKIAESLKGKKAKVKALSDELNNTKAVKLDKGLKEGLEQALGADLSKVRVHSGGNAGDLCKSIKAKAFTQGFNIAVAKPGDAKNGKLLAHELTHVVQQANGKMPKAKPGKVLVSK